MTAFSLTALKPASAIEGLGKPDKSAPKTAKQTAIANIDAQLALLDPRKEGKRTFWDKVVDGKRSYDGKGASVGFFLKAGSVKLMLGGTQEVGVAKTDFEATLKGIKSAIEKGELDEQLATIDSALTARKAKAKTTREGKKAQPAKG